MKRILILVAAFAALSLTGCASMMSGTTQQVKVESNPSDADVYTAVASRNGAISNLQKVAVTPTAFIENKSTKSKKKKVQLTTNVVTIKRKDGIIIVKKEGYVDAIITPRRTMNPWVLGDVLLTSLLSTSIDTSTGASNEIDPNHFFVELKPVQLAEPAQK